MSRTNKRYSKDLKTKVVKLYLDGTHTAKELCEIFDINDTKRIYVWTKQYENGIIKGHTEEIDMDNLLLENSDDFKLE